MVNDSLECTCLFIAAYYNYPCVSNTGKFNCSVPGTLFSSTTKCPSSIPSSSEVISSLPVTSNIIATIASQIPSKDSPFHFEVGSPLFYGVIAIGSVIITVLLCLMVACVSVFYKRQFKRKFS